MTEFVKVIVTIVLFVFTKSIWGHNPILTAEKKEILGITTPHLSEVRSSTIPPSTSEGLEDLYSSSTLEPKPPLLQTQWFPGEGITPPICSDEINANLSEKYVVTINGTVMISVITKDPTSAAFIVNRINKAKLINGSFTIGIRAIQINDKDKTAHIFLEEVEYLQRCVEYPIGILVDNEIYKDIIHVIDDLDYNVWPMQSSRKLSFQRYSLLMQQLPWNDKLESVEIRPDDNTDDSKDFIDAVKEEKICLMHFKSPKTLYVLLSEDFVRNFEEEGHLFVLLENGTEETFVKGSLVNTFGPSVNRNNIIDDF